MSNTFLIQINQAITNAYVGIYASEQNNSQPILVAIKVQMPAHLFEHENLNTTINYEKIWQIVLQTFEQKWQLLESAAVHISQQIMQLFNCQWPIEIALTKTKPIIPNFNGQVGICYQCNY
jgi:FolB domain-containing protein